MPFPSITTERLHLRRPYEGDTEGFADLLSDPTCYPYISDSGPVAAEAVPDRITRFATGYDSGSSIHWVLEDRSNGAFVGYVAVHEPRKVPSYLSYGICKSFRRRGFAREALLGLCANATMIGCVSFVAHTHLENTASRELLLDIGFREIGCVSTAAGDRIEYRWEGESPRARAVRQSKASGR